MKTMPGWLKEFAASAYEAGINPLPILRKLFGGEWHWFYWDAQDGPKNEIGRGHWGWEIGSYYTIDATPESADRCCGLNLIIWKPD